MIARIDALLTLGSRPLGVGRIFHRAVRTDWSAIGVGAERDTVRQLALLPAAADEVLTADISSAQRSAEYCLVPIGSGTLCMLMFSPVCIYPARTALFIGSGGPAHSSQVQRSGGAASDFDARQSRCWLRYQRSNHGRHPLAQPRQERFRCDAVCLAWHLHRVEQCRRQLRMSPEVWHTISCTESGPSPNRSGPQRNAPGSWAVGCTKLTHQRSSGLLSSS